MALKLEDLINKKKEPNQILDLSKVKITSKEEFERYYDKLPEFKIRPEKVRPEDVRIRDKGKDLAFKSSRKGAKKDYSYDDPCPTSMRGVRLEDLAAVDISWRMLTMLRPKNRLEEDIFNRIVELGKLRVSTRNWEQKQIMNTSSGTPGSQASSMMQYLGITVIKTKRGTTETRIKICKECGLELCTGTLCKEYPYDSYTRMIADPDEVDKEDGPAQRRSSKSKTIKGPGQKAQIKPPKGRGISNLPKKRRVKKKKKKSNKKTGPSSASEISDNEEF